MISCGIQVPEPALDSQDRVGERKILRRSIERKPDPTQTVWRDQQIVVRHVAIIVPNKSAMPCRLVDEDGQPAQRDSAQQPEHAPVREGVFHSVRYYLSPFRLPKRFW